MKNEIEGIKVPARTVMTPHLRALLSEQPVSRHFPVKFSNGAQWESVTCTCGECGARIAGDHLRGGITVPFEVIAVMDAVGFCDRCEVITPYHIRYGANGNVGVWNGRRYRWLNKVRKTWKDHMRSWLYQPVMW